MPFCVTSACLTGLLAVELPFFTNLAVYWVGCTKAGEAEFLLGAEIDDDDLAEAAVLIGQSLSPNPARRPRSRLHASAKLAGGVDAIELHVVAYWPRIKQIASQRRGQPSAKRLILKLSSERTRQCA